ncbi:hypothetical protein SKAU_G00392240 [Synaphobranchus kaupii]|uniref:Uncharacterized protein n=1 Tax=Synaphobranchus kaupii TaxID=118154 RepID=A0A9Q1IDQ3_SYNKA|nr:hypothetical protein SKAU_G00392240 [Synaphobranchus kaupii]
MPGTTGKPSSDAITIAGGSRRTVDEVGGCGFALHFSLTVTVPHIPRPAGNNHLHRKESTKRGEPQTIFIASEGRASYTAHAERGVAVVQGQGTLADLNTRLPGGALAATPVGTGTLAIRLRTTRHTDINQALPL